VLPPPEEELPPEELLPPEEELPPLEEALGLELVREPPHFVALDLVV